MRKQLLAVPFYQRSYSWHVLDEATNSDASGDDKVQIDEFWEDLTNSFQAQQSYFLGTVVLANDGGDSTRKLVIDGQQRLATTSILVASIRDELRKQGSEEYAESAHNDFIGTFDRKIGSSQPRLILNSDDRAYYNEAVVDARGSIQPTNHSQELIGRAYTRLRQYVSEFTDAAGTDWLKKLNDLLNYLDDDVQVVAIDVATEADAFLIFETLNDRGADLTVADLLKNYLFSQSGSRLDEVRDKWVTTLANLGLEKVGNQRFTSFARHLMSSKYGRTRERELYGKIRGTVSGSVPAVTFAQELKDSSRLYYALLSVDSDYWSEFPENTRSAAQVLVDLNLEQYRPLLLAVLAEFDSKEIVRFVPTLVSWTIRGLAGGTLGAGSAESAFCEAAREIRSGNIKTTEQILEVRRVSSLISADATFHTDFEVWRVTRGSLARYLLRALEDAERGEQEPELVVNSNPDQVNLEHILPRSPRPGYWNEFSEDERKTWVHRLGNMCLIQKGPNGRIGNKPWKTKAPVLAASQLKLTSKLGNETQWNKHAIESHQEYLADLAVEVWPRTPRRILGAL